jgi:hypothetical protein
MLVSGKRFLKCVTIGILVMFAAVPSYATTIQIFQGPLAGTLAAFQAVTGATSIVSNFPNVGLIADGTLNNEGSYAGVATFSYISPSTQLYSGVGGTFTDAFGSQFTDWTSLLAGPDLAISNSENLLTANLPVPTYSLGFEFVEPTVHSARNPGPNVLSGVVDSTFTVTLLNGAIGVSSFTFNATDDIAYFVGVWSDTAFNKVDIRETTGGIDNEYFNRFYQGSTPIPEPATLLLLSTGLFGVGLAAWRRRK